VTSVDYITRRALTAFAASDGPEAVKVSDAHSGRVSVYGRGYVVLRDKQGRLLAVYRHRPSGMLRRLRRWPREIEPMEGGR
jgi:hypothetical protein